MKKRLISIAILILTSQVSIARVLYQSSESSGSPSCPGVFKIQGG